ncbi:MAG: cell division protein ZapA [Gammaproteobacteria bacterium]|uniref:cell division protein ZapA n=1 Tax=Pseudomaricurvus alcaniphilus TaxID=1166482 RepID=UPI00140BC6A5|nr:cell division protein ZapA [Pseudomaricurvus alcaniphilus]MBR9912235.1 cell division protein ZapA [Gammaproteobacteria bacterium]NHN38701.1 cell division protein ZapA [Pseudomaricurvus alcaniphilus]
MSGTMFVKILDKEYQVACPPGEEQALNQAARTLDERMRSIRGKSSVIGLERIAVMAALNLSHELLQANSVANSKARDEAVIQRLTSKVEQALSND